MASETELEERVKKAKNILNHVSLPIARIGLWPVNITTNSRIKLAIYLLYHGFQLTMELTDLYLVRRDLQSVINNLMITSFQATIAFRVLCVRFHPGIRQVIYKMNEFHKQHIFNNDEEKKLYVSHIERVQRFHDFMMLPVWISAISWFLTPALLHFSTRGDPNNTIPLTDPFRMPSFFDMSNPNVALFVYIIDLPMLYGSICYSSVYSIQFAFITGICARLALLSHQIKNLASVRFVNMPHAFRHIVEKHIKIIELSNTLDDACCILLFLTLLNAVLRVTLLWYNLIVNFSTTGTATLISLTTYLALIMFCIYVNCYMGEYLLSEAVNLFNAFSECDWHNIPQSYQKAFVICMAQANCPLKMSAGKFYVFTLNGFTGIMRTCGAYVSVLRTM